MRMAPASSFGPSINSRSSPWSRRRSSLANSGLEVASSTSWTTVALTHLYLGAQAF